MTNPGATAIPQTDTPPTAAPAPPENIQVVVLQTTLGKMVLQLDDFAAPKTCANFRNLVSTGFYNGTIFHRVIPHFVIQGGDPNSKTDNRASYGQGDPGYTLPAEIKLSHDRGAVAMARLPDTVNPRQDSNGSQFYICVEACPSLDDQYTVFAHVIRGMDVAERIAAVPRDNRDDPLVRIVMDARLEPKDQAMQESPAVNR
jgi:peptidyl-prolyl cis-trans isomerase B (cyclophilin B)